MVLSPLLNSNSLIRSALPLSAPEGITDVLCTFAHDLTLAAVPDPVKQRVKHILLDGFGSALVSAPLSWSLTATNAVFALDGSATGPCSLIGRPTTEHVSATSACLLNSAYVQGFELDDFHRTAPVHGCALVIPALLAAAELLANPPAGSGSVPVKVTGQDILLAAIVGFEIGPRIGLGLGGQDILARGWHSGAVFGGTAVALVIGKMMGLGLRQMEWAVGLATTQSCGLMSAQFGSMAKR